MNCFTKRERNYKLRAISHKKRKLIERAFGCNKSDRHCVRSSCVA